MTCSSSSFDSHPEKKRKVYLTRSKSKLLLDEEAKIEQRRNLILQYSVDPYEYSNEFLIEASVEFFHYYHLQEIYNFTDDSLLTFITAVKELYNPDNNFHNFKHAWGVLHMSFQILVHGADKCFSSSDIFAILIAAVCHDVGHPGNNNAFEFAIKSDVSKLYFQPNENCVLERYHVGLTQKLLFPRIETVEQELERQSTNLILNGLNEKEKEGFFELVNFIILGTDMAKHGLLVKEAQTLAEQVKSASSLSLTSSYSSSDSDNGTAESKSNNIPKASRRKGRTTKQGDEEDSGLISPVSSVASVQGRSHHHMTPKFGSKHVFQRLGQENSLIEEIFGSNEARRTLARILVHTADIGAQTQEYSIAFKWVNRCYTEFQTQACREKELGIMTSPFLHELTDDKKIFASQYSFINDIVEPIWSAVAEIFPDMKFASSQLINNKLLYKNFF